MYGEKKRNLEHFIQDGEETRRKFEKLDKFVHVIIRESLEEKTNKTLIEIWREVEKKIKKMKKEKEKEREREMREGEINQHDRRETRNTAKWTL